MEEHKQECQDKMLNICKTLIPATELAPMIAPTIPLENYFLSNFITVYYQLLPPIINTCMCFHFILYVIRKSRKEIIPCYPFPKIGVGFLLI